MQRAVLAVLCCSCGLVFARHDIRMVEPIHPNGLFCGRGPVEPGVWIHNEGDTVERHVPARIWVDSAGTRVYEGQSSSPGPVHPRMPALFGGFPDWHFRPGYCTYDVTAIAELANDENRANDTAHATVTVVLGQRRDTVEFHGPMMAEVDGSIESWEWGWGYDISDSLGQAGTPRPLGCCLFHTGFNWDTAYMAIDVLTLTTREDGDRIVVKLDENGDGLWAPDSSEGTYSIFVSGGVDSVVYTYLPGQQCPGARSASGVANGNLQFEFAIPIGSERSDITLSGYVSRAAISAWRGDSCYGWWPGHLEMEHWEDPAYYGVFEWLIMPVQEDVRDDVRVGRRVSTILPGNGLLPSGGRILDIQGRDVTREKAMLSPGIYFLRQEADNSTRKVIVQH
jgi:hypothetical protein